MFGKLNDVVMPYNYATYTWTAERLCDSNFCTWKAER
jgi:hypothetical protein